MYLFFFSISLDLKDKNIIYKLKTMGVIIINHVPILFANWALELIEPAPEPKYKNK
jgi:hypothetical protein